MKSMALGRRHATPPAKPAPKVVQQLQVLEDAIGGRDVLVAALAHAPKSNETQYLLGLIGDPTEHGTSLAELCARGGITPGELLEAYKSGEINRAQALSTREVGKRLHEVAADTIRMSLPRTTTCTQCEGNGTIVAEPSKRNPNPVPEKCRTCAGTGTITVEGDVEHKKLTLEMGKLLTKGGGVQVGVNVTQNNANFASAGGALERLQEATDAILFGGGAGISIQPIVDVVDGEVEDEESGAQTVAADAMLDEDWRGEAQS